MSIAPEKLKSLNLTELSSVAHIGLVQNEKVDDNYQDPVFRSLSGVVLKDFAGLDQQNDRLEFKDSPRGWIAKYLIELAAKNNNNVEVNNVLDPIETDGYILDITARATIAESGLYEQGCYEILKNNKVKFSDWNDNQLQAMVDGYALTEMYSEGQITEQMVATHIGEILLLTVFSNNN